MSAPVITVPAFASARDGVRHFFGTRRHADLLALDVGVPARQSGAKGRGWLKDSFPKITPRRRFLLKPSQRTEDVHDAR